MEYIIIYALDQGVEVMRGSGADGFAAIQRPPEGHAVLSLPQEAMNGDLADHADLVRDALWAKVKAKRDAVISSGATTPAGHVADSDPASQMNIAGAVVASLIADAAGQPFSVDWTMADNTVEPLDSAEIKAVGQAVFAHVNAAHAAARALRAAIESAEDLTALLKIDVAAGWPE